MGVVVPRLSTSGWVNAHVIPGRGLAPNKPTRASLVRVGLVITPCLSTYGRSHTNVVGRSSLSPDSPSGTPSSNGIGSSDKQQCGKANARTMQPLIFARRPRISEEERPARPTLLDGLPLSRRVPAGLALPHDLFPCVNGKVTFASARCILLVSRWKRRLVPQGKSR
jgi:hypothetical protein